MPELFTLNGALPNNPGVEEWLYGEPAELFAIARQWFRVMRNSAEAVGEEIGELMHDGYATACIDGAAFAYVGVFKAHVNVGFFTGAALEDPQELLQGTGKRMRHVKIKPGTEVDETALTDLIYAAYADVKNRLGR